jgi:ribose transport system substrate-binding protein
MIIRVNTKEELIMLKMKKVLSILVSGVMTLGLLSGCSGNQSQGSNNDSSDASATTAAATQAADSNAGGAKKRIGISLVYKGDEWCAAVADEFAKQAEKFGYEVNIQDGNLDNETQIKQIENFVAQQYDLIMVDPINAEGIVPGIETARAAGIPVMSFDSPAAYDDLVSYVSWDSYETGQIIGNYLHDRIKNEMGGKANVVLLTMASPVAIGERIKGVKDALADLDITYVAEQEYEGNREKAANVVTNIKEPFDFVIAGQDNGAWGAVSALEALNNKDVEVYSMGAYGEECFTTLQKGTSNYRGSVAVSPSELVKSCYETATEHFEGKTDIPDRVNINLDLINVENINEYLAR